MAAEKVCIYHIAEIYLYEYYHQPESYEIPEEDAVAPLLAAAGEQEKKGGLPAAMQDYEKALKWNPVSTEIYFRLIDCCYRLNNLELLHTYTLEVYPYLATRAELAQYYRYLGYYHLEKMHPALAMALYRYSTYFEPSDSAEHEIRYLEAAMEHSEPKRTPQELQNILTKAGIPVRANAVTLALLVKAGEEAEQRSDKALKDGNDDAEQNWRQQAVDCYQMVYDLTQDEEIENRLRTLL